MKRVAVVGAGGAGKTRLAAADRWVMDGTYAATLGLRLERADTVAFLDLPPLLCPWQVVRRWALGHLHPAPDLPAGLRPKLDRRFLAYVLTFRRRRRPALLAELARWDGAGRVVILSSRRAARQFLAGCGLDYCAVAPRCLTEAHSEHRFG
jgi:hypothetical protein